MTRNGIRRVRIPNPISDHGDRPLTGCAQTIPLLPHDISPLLQRRGWECRGRRNHPFGDSSSAARSFTIKAMN